MSLLIAPFLRRAVSMHAAGLAATILVLVMLTACSVPFGIAQTKETTYTMDGKTYVLQEFNFKDQHNFTLWEIVSGERNFAALYDDGEDRVADVFTSSILEGEGHLTTIMTVVQNGKQQGETVTSSQQSVEPRVVEGE